MSKTVQNQRVYRQVADQIQQLILDGTFRCGDRLPPERDLAEQFQVSRTSVREAVRALDILGVVECRQGGGNYISPDFSACLLEPMSLLFKLQSGTFEELLQLRSMLESEAAMLSARNLSDDGRDQLRAIVEELETAASESERARADRAFHQLLIDGSGNRLMQSFYRALASLMDLFVKDARKLLEGKGLVDDLLLHHQAICQAVCAGDGQGAAEEIHRHFQLIIDNQNR